MTQDSKKLVGWGGLIIFFTLIAVYAIFAARELIFGIEIENISLVDGMVYHESVQKVSGNAKNAIKLTLNGREISINQEGDFAEMIALSPGYNIVNIRAVDKFGYVDEKNYKLMFIGQAPELVSPE